jgi:hypothetical protein
MNSTEYIISELKSFINEFPQTRVRYENDTNADTHFIEVIPNEIYHLDSNYIQWESSFFDKFIAQFPAQNICFISDDAIVGLDRIDYEIIGKEFVDMVSINQSSYAFILSQPEVKQSNLENQQFTISFFAGMHHYDNGLVILSNIESSTTNSDYKPANSIPHEDLRGAAEFTNNCDYSLAA